MRFYANVRERGILVPKTPRPEVTYNAASLTSLWHHVDPKQSIATGFQCIAKFKKKIDNQLGVSRESLTTPKHQKPSLQCSVLRAFLFGPTKWHS